MNTPKNKGAASMGMNNPEFMDKMNNGIANSYVEPEKQVYVPAGRVKGSKNKTTIFKDIMRNGFEEEMKTDFLKVMKTVINKAVDGDMVAAKMLFDRVLPTSKAIDINASDKSKGTTISINIGSLEDGISVISEDDNSDNQDIIDGEFTEDDK